MAIETTITTPPPAPERLKDARIDFAKKMDARLAAEDVLVAEMTQWAGECNATQGEINAAADQVAGDKDIVATDKAIVAADKVEAAASAVTAISAPGTSATSTTSLTIDKISQSLTIQTGKSIVPGMSVKIAYTTAPTSWMHGDVTAYDSGTGALTVNVTNAVGTGTYALWTVSLSSPVVSTADVTETLTNKTFGAGTVYESDALAALHAAALYF